MSSYLNMSPVERSLRARTTSASAILTVDLAAIVENYRLLRNQVGASACAAVVKADAYGLGVAHVAPALAGAGCRQFFVAHLDEGVTLRRILGPEVDIAVLHGAPSGSEPECLAHSLVPVLNDEAQRLAWKAQAERRGEPLPAMLQFDTGMARFGYSVADAIELLREPQALEGIDLRLVMSHLACADDPADPANAAQRELFDSLRRKLPSVPASLAASSGIFLGPDYHFDMVRPGAALFGVNPRLGRSNPMLPVVGLRARVVQVRSVPTGTPIGYGHARVTSRPSRLATVAVGYADGFFRSASDSGLAVVDDHRLPVLGRVSMDSIVVDVTDVPPSSLGPAVFVEIIGPHRGVDDVASAAGTIGYEVLTALGHRFHRTYFEA
ncbi:alanine racemase [Methylorubrum thiocyanatum]|uniref:alanine racemase n=1 Tax=Methylorubrum thiocyanatum TaxID=47958 RepID=UPI00383A71EF